MAVKDLVSGVLAESITTSTTNILVTIAQSIGASGIQAFFPTPPFYITIMPKTPAIGVANRLDSEILQVTAVGNDQVGNAALTCVRGQRDTTAKAFEAGSVVTVGVYTDDAVLLGGTGTTETEQPWVNTNDIIDGSITSEKLDWSTIGNITTPATNRNVIKFGNGLMICWGKATGSKDITTQVTALYSGTSYRSDGLPAISFGATFISAPSVSVDIHPPANSTASFSVTPWEQSGATTTGIGGNAYVMTRANSRTGVAFEYDYIAIGKWK